MKIVWLIVGLALAGYTFRKIEIQYRKNRKKKQDEIDVRMWKVETMRKLKSLKKYDANGYERETKEVVSSFNQRIDEMVEHIVTMKGKEEGEGILTLFEEAENLKRNMTDAHRQIDELLTELEEHVQYIASFLNATHFYPPHFALDNNKLSGMVVEIKDRRKTNPFLVTEKYRLFGHHLRKEVETFQNQHQEVTRLIEEIEQKLPYYGNDKQQKVLEKKQQLFISLHKGEMQDVEKQKKEMMAFIQ